MKTMTLGFMLIVCGGVLLMPLLVQPNLTHIAPGAGVGTGTTGPVVVLR